MKNWRKQDRLASVILVVLFMTGLLDGYIGLLNGSNRGVFEPKFLIDTIIISVLVLYWIYLDAANFIQRRPATGVIIALLVFLPIGVWIHLMKTRGAAAGSLIAIIAVIINFAAYMGGLYLGETLG